MLTAFASVVAAMLPLLPPVAVVAVAHPLAVTVMHPLVVAVKLPLVVTVALLPYATVVIPPPAPAALRIGTART